MSSENGSIQKSGKAVRILILIGCIVLLLFGVLLIFGGAALLAYNMGTDADGYSQSSIYEVRSDAHAFALWVAPSRFPSYLTWMSPKDIGQAVWTVEPVNSSKKLFVGWAEAADGKNYVEKMMFSTPPTWRWYIEAYYAEIEIPPSLTHNQGAPTRPPAEETFWIETAQSNGTSKITWDAFWEPLENRKMLIIMNADGSRNVEADIQLGFKVPIFGWLAFVLLPVGVIFCLIGVLVIRQKKLIKFPKR
ncbi:MAG: hypothetical protein PVH73_00180 [Candidatus Bathyarchaeota archaeon]